MAVSSIPSFENTQIAFQYKSNKDLRMAKWLFASMASPFITNTGIGITQWSLKAGLPIEGIIRKTIFKQFCGGETMQEAAQTAAKIAPYKVGVILDYGAEGMHSEEAFDAVVPEFLRAIEYASGNKDIPFICFKITAFARFELLEKLHNKEELSNVEAAEWHKVKSRVQTICHKALEKQVKVLIDAEESWIQQPVDDLADEMMAHCNKQKAIVFNTFQLYQHDRFEFLRQSFAKAAQQNYFLGAKLVRGAYMEKERARAEEMNYPSPIQPNKEACDKDFDAAVVFCLERLSQLHLFIGTHNEESSLKAARYMDEHNTPHNHPHVFFSQLYGMSDNISFNLAHAGYNVAKYLPYGPIKDVMPYLMRRAQENTSVAGQTSRELVLIKKEVARRKN